MFYVPIMCAPKIMLSMFITKPYIVEMGYGTLRLFFSTYVTLELLILTITLFQALGNIIPHLCFFNKKESPMLSFINSGTA